MQVAFSNMEMSNDQSFVMFIYFPFPISERHHSVGVPLLLRISIKKSVDYNQKTELIFLQVAFRNMEMSND